jgi:hypothetical protein
MYGCVSVMRRGLPLGVLATMVAILVVLMSAAPSFAQGGPTDKQKLGVLDVQANPAVIEKARREGKLGDLEQIIQALDGQLQISLHGTRRFDVVARRGIENMLGEQDFQRWMAQDPVKLFQLAKVQHGVMIEIDDFNDATRLMESRREGSSGRIARGSREVFISMQIRIYTVETGVMFEASRVEFKVEKGVDYGQSTADPMVVRKQLEGLLEGVPGYLTDRGTREILNRLYPNRVSQVIGREVYLTWAEGTTVAPGQSWDVYALKEVESLDFPGQREFIEVPMGRIEIVRVTSNNAVARIVGEDRGIARGATARLDETHEIERLRNRG